MEKMRSAFLVNYGKASEAFELREVNKPLPTNGQVGVKVEAFGLNFAEVSARHGLYREAPPLPFIPGYDFVGRVEVVGEGVDQAWIGKRVAGMARFGTYSTYCCTLATGVTEIPESMPTGEATAIGVQYSTAFYASCVAMNLFPGDEVLVHAGAGGVGTALIQLCKWKGCTVIATGSSDEKLKRMREIGADHAINYLEEDYEKAVNRILGKKKLDATFNAIAGKTFKKDMNLLGSGGRMVLYGAADRMGKKGGRFATYKLLYDMGLMLPIFLMAKSKSVIGVNMLKLADYRPHIIGHCLQELIKLYDQGIVKPQISAVYPIEELAKAHEDLEFRRTMGKIAIKW